MVSRHSQVTRSKSWLNESILPFHILTAHSPDLAFSQDVDCFITLDGPSGRLEIAESLLGVHAPLDGSVILFQDIVQVLHYSARRVRLGEARNWHFGPRRSRLK